MIGSLTSFIFRIYKIGISPFIPPACRFEPSCSEYAQEAFKRHGVFKGTYLTIRRLCRCQPFGSCGYDPVPEKTTSSRLHS